MQFLYLEKTANCNLLNSFVFTVHVRCFLQELQSAFICCSKHSPSNKCGSSSCCSLPLHTFPYFSTHARSPSCLIQAYTFSSLLPSILFLSMPFFSLPIFIKLLLRLTFILFSAFIFAHALSSHPIYSCVAFLLPNVPSGIIWLK